MDDLPKGFDLKEGKFQSETPTLPVRVIREAVVNALMHRSYREHQPTQIIQYSNRIEIKNVGFSLKNEDSLGEAGSQLRNPYITAIFHETNTAETKGSGIRTMRKLMKAHGFSLPTFESNRTENYFVARLLLHHFLSEKDMLWLNKISCPLTDSQKVALIFVREQGAIDNQTLRQLTDCDVLNASNDLRRLRDAKLLIQKGKGAFTYYAEGPDFPVRSFEFNTNEHDTLAAEHDTLMDDLPRNLRKSIISLGPRPGEKIRSIILELCKWKDLSASQLAYVLGGRNAVALKREHLSPMIQSKQLAYIYPDMEKHPQQAYRTVL